MDAHLIDSAVYGHGWSTAESVAIFSERARLERWVHVLKALAAAQADLEIIPQASARAIDGLDAQSLDPAALGAETRRTSHSTIGLVRELQSRLPEHAREHVYYGATVQDVSDTAAALEMRDVGGIVWRDLRAVEGSLLDLAARHRDTPMLGRTHGQPGAPVTFGLKAASWADETARHLERWRQSRPRLVVGQLAGAVGALGFYGELGPGLRRRFCERLGLGEPSISWLTARDRIAEFASNAALVSATMARMANEVYNLQRREIGEVAEAASEATMGSITMPHKRNPERSEQMVTLSRLVRSAAGVLTETMVGDHERDGRTWKTEWVLLPELSHYLLAQLGLASGLAASIEVDAEAMAANLETMGDFGSQELLRRLSARLGKHRANDELQQAYRTARLSGRPLTEVLEQVASPAELEGLDRPETGAAAAMVDAVVAAATGRRSAETDEWA
ncbi:MAG: adenylosuccinate lyase family protein [Acidimicrobiaceae bacterium]|nr:adenylosuccinate lyase family protein [Acidimicrobiaceae bacterium]MDE0655205.1 adenylosuccinate lyase family protein [Acidimicrobiaceae bacterium]MXZ96488.1 adenylosuccinate lyase family protein [Acidimicrobiaceae bacterium]MYF41845.1 adenylosuccinate lyase family protein [Acidimicrobiaceae bacterium]